MAEKLEDLLEEELKKQIDELSGLKAGSEERAKAVEGIAKLYKLKIEETKAKADSEEKRKQSGVDNGYRTLEIDYRDNELELRKGQLKEQRVDRYFRTGIAAAELILPLVFYGMWMKKGFKFEEEGTFTSTTFRGLFNKFRPTKK